MKIAIFSGSPPNVHFFKNIIKELSEKRHIVKVYARYRKITQYLLKYYNIKYVLISERGTDRFGLLGELIKQIYKLVYEFKKFKPDVIFCRTLAPLCAAKLLGIRSISDDDDGPACDPMFTLIKMFKDIVITPDCLPNFYGPSQIKYAGYKELSYLHPNYFTPDKDKLKKYGINPDEKYFVIRLSAYDAVHDFNRKGLNRNQVKKIIELLKQHGRIFITSEAGLDKELQDYKINLPPHLIFHLMYFAHLYIGDSQTMAAEAAVLGTPSIRISPFSKEVMFYLKELEEKYGLVYSYLPSEVEVAYNKIKYLLSDKTIKKQWAQRRKKMLSDKIDVVEWMVDLIEKIYLSKL